MNTMLSSQGVRMHRSSDYGDPPEHGKQAREELLDMIEMLLEFSRAGTLYQEPGEEEAWERASALLMRYGRPGS